MAKLFFPQLASGALVQYPFQRARTFRTIRNVLRDGSMISLPDYDASNLRWELVYSGLSREEMTSLKALFDATSGRWQPFCFIDPSANMFAWSSDLTRSPWNRSSLIRVSAGQADPVGGQNAFQITNNGQTLLDVSQTLTVPASYMYCLSGWVKTAVDDQLCLVRQGSAADARESVAIGSEWRRIWSSGQLEDGGSSLTCGLTLAPGQSISVYGLQLEAQLSSSGYRATFGQSAVYPECFWVEDRMQFTADGPNSFSTLLQIETNV